MGRRCGFVSGGIRLQRRSHQRPSLNMCAATTPASTTQILDVKQTGGGSIVDCQVTHASKVTQHTVIVGNETVKMLCDGTLDCVEPSTLVQYIFAFFIEQKKDLTNTQGLLEVSTFPINYFSARSIFYFYPDAETRLKEMIAAGKT